MGWMHRDHAWGGHCRRLASFHCRLVRSRAWPALSGIAATVVLPFDNLLGQMDQHPLCPMIQQFVKSSQQAQSEKRLQRIETRCRCKVAFRLLGSCGLAAAEFKGDVEG